MLKKLKTKLKVWYFIMNNYFMWRSKTRTHQYSANRPSVFFALSDINQEHYYYPIIFSFHEMGYNIYLKDRIKFIGHSFGPAKLIYDLPRLFIKDRPHSNTDLIITDQRKTQYKIKSRRKNIVLIPIAFQGQLNNGIILPYPMHPNAYHTREFMGFERLRKKERERRVLFSGNTDPGAYQNPLISQKFRKINRVEVIETLLNRLHTNELIIIKKKEDKQQIPKNYFSGLLLFLWKWSPNQSEGLEIRVENHQWHEFLATGDFFLCCPGVVIPQSHNAIEAMSVGTIPILQYPEFFHPQLQDGINCISFSNEEELVQKVRQCILMSEDVILEMRNNVIEYYDTFLHHLAPAKIIEALPDGRQEIFFYNESC